MFRKLAASRTSAFFTVLSIIMLDVFLIIATVQWDHMLFTNLSPDNWTGYGLGIVFDSLLTIFTAVFCCCNISFVLGAVWPE
jgi:uncharacterized membrane protein